jgi:hypothetical protein
MAHVSARRSGRPHPSNVVSHVHSSAKQVRRSQSGLLVRSEWQGVDLRVAHHHSAVRAAASAAVCRSEGDLNQPFGPGTRRSGRRWSLVWRCPAGASDDPSRSLDSPERPVHCFGTQLAEMHLMSAEMHLMSSDCREVNEAAHVAKSTTEIVKNC